MVAEETTHIRVPADLRLMLRRVAEADGRTMQGVLRRALTEYAIRHDLSIGEITGEGR